MSNLPVSITFLVFHGVGLGLPPSQLPGFHTSQRRSPFFFFMLLVWAHLGLKFLDVIIRHVHHLSLLLMLLVWAHLQVKVLDVRLPHVDHRSSFLMLLVWAHLLDVILPNVDRICFMLLVWAHLQVKCLDVILPHVDHLSLLSCCWFGPTPKSNS